MSGSLSASRVYRYVAIATAIAAVLSFGPRTSSQGRDPQTILIDGHEAVAGDVIVKMKSGLGSIRRLQLEQQIDAEQSEPVGSTMRRIRSRRFDVRTLLDFLRTHPDVAFAEPNYILHATALPNDPYFSPYLWGLQNTGQLIGVTGIPGADIHATQAWDLSTGSRSNVVAVIDTGIDYTHPELAANIWSAPTSFTVNIGGLLITCPAGTHGFNAIAMTCDPRDDNNHGTHVSGTIGGVGNNGQGVAGVNWTASIMGSKFLSASGGGSTVGAINAIEFTIQAKAAFASTAGANVRVLSNSWGGGGFSQALLDEINKANANDMLFVAAAGNGDAFGNGLNNSTNPFFPANYTAPNVISVAASDNTDQKALFSNYGPLVHLAAPGVNVLSTTIGNTYQFFSGTSMATPHVSGAAALILSRCALTTAALKATILNNVDVVGALTGWVSTNGRLNVDRALRSCTPDQPPTISAIPNKAINVNTAIGFSFTVADPDTPLANLTLSATSSNQSLLPNANISFSGSGGTRTINLQSANLSGPTTLSVTVNDGTLTASTTFLLTVVRDVAPTISAIPDQITNQGAPTSAVAFTVDDIDSPAAGLTLSGASSNTTLVPNASIVFGGSGANRTVTVTPAAGLSGSATITVFAYDGFLDAATSFVVNVLPPTLLVLDTFTGADATPLTGHAPDLNLSGNRWTITGATPMPTLQNGRAAVGAGGGHLQATIDSGVADIRIATDYRAGAGPGLGALAFRLTDADNFLLLETNSNNLQFYRRQGGTWTLLASTQIALPTPGSTHRLEVRAAGSALQALWDGVLYMQVTDSFQQTATRHGLDWNSAYDTTATYDNFFLDDGRPAVAQVAVTPNPVSVMAGNVQTATARARDASNNFIPGTTFTWATADPAIATVTSTGAATASVTGVAAGATTLTATAPNAVSTTINVTVTSAPVVTHVAIVPTPLAVLAGGAQTAIAQASDANNAAMPGITFTWATADPGIATVTSTGAATASVAGIAAGPTTLTATAPNGVSATVAVTVAAPPSNMLVSDTFSGADTTPLTSHTPDLNVTGHAWTLTGAAPTPTLQNGRAAVATGTGHLQLTIDSGASDIQMATDYIVGSGPGLGALAFRLTDANNFLLLETNGGSLQFYRRQGGAWILLATAPIGTLTAGSTHRLEVRATGLRLEGWWDGVLTVQTTDSFQQTATRHGLDWNSAYDVTTTYDNFTLLNGSVPPVVAHVTISPTPVTVLAGGAQTATAQASDAGNTLIPNVTFTWATADPTIATVTSTGAATANITGVSAGTTTLTATAPNAVSTTINVVVTSPPVVTHVAISPTPVTVVTGGAQVATAQASDAGNVPIPGVTFTWATADPSIATVTSIGAATASVTGVAAGTTTLTATAPNAVSATIAVNVSAVPSNLLVSDTFTGVDATLLTTHTPDRNVTGHAWTLTGATPTPTLQGGRAAVAAGSGHLQLTIDSGAADIQMATDFIAGAGPGLGALAFRLTDANNFLLLETNGGNLQFYRRQGGTWILLATAPIPTLAHGSTHRLEVRANGSALQGWWDGVLTVQITDSFQQTATRHGLDWNSGYDATTTYDNFTLVNGSVPPVVAHVAIAPTPLTVLAGSAQTATAQASDAGNAIIPGVTFTWATADPTIATVTSTGAATASVTGVMAGATTLTATAPNAVSTTINVVVASPPVVTHVAISPTPVTVVTGGAQVATAQASDAGNVPIPGVTFTWATADPSIATVTSTGAATASVTGVAAGATTLTATAPNAVSATIAVTVSAVPSNLLVSDTFTGVDATLLTTHTPDRNVTGHPWTLTGATPTPTLQSGRAAVAAGSGHLQLTIDSGAADIQMATDFIAGAGPGLGALAFRLTDANNFLLLEAVGGNLQFYRRQGGTWILLASAPIGTLTAGSTHRLEVRATAGALQGWWDGALTVQTTDSFQQTATRHGLDWNSAYDATTTYDNFTLLNGSIPPVVAHVAISPTPVTVLAGSAQTATAQASDAGNAIIPGVTFTWATADPTIATVNSTGAATASVTGVMAGTTTLTATAPNAVSTTINVVVASPPVVTHVAISPTLVTVVTGGAQVATAQASDAGNVPIPGVTFTWATADPSIATVTSTGAATASVTGVAAGATTLTATAPNAVSATIAVTVSAAPSNLLVSDTFTGVDATVLTTHMPDRNVTGHAWTLTGATPTPTLQSGRAAVAAGSGHLQLTIDSGAADILMATDFIVGSGPGLGALAFRLTDANNFLLLETNSSNLQFYRRQGGTWILLASKPIALPTAGSTHRLEVRAVGSALQGWWDNALTLQIADSFQQTATRHGLDWNSAYDATSTYDNFLLQGAPSTPLPPTLVSLSPANVVAGGPAFTLMATGTNFVAASVVRVDGVARTTAFVSATQLRAAIPAGDIAAVGSHTITVFTPAPGGGTSNAATLTMISAASLMTYHGGPVQHTQKIYTIFWNPTATAFPSGYQTTINRFVQDLNGSSYYAIASQYGDTVSNISTVVSYGGTWLDTSNAFPSSTVSLNDIFNEVNRAMTANGWLFDVSTYFQVYTPDGIHTTTGFCGWHNDAVFPDNSPAFAFGHIVFPGVAPAPGFTCMPAAGPFPNGQLTDFAIDVSAHEILETVTDPFFTGWYHLDGSGEIGDLCNFNFGTRAADGSDVTLNGHNYLIQQEWSNAVAGCVLSTPPPASTPTTGALEHPSQ